jgi:hypothetical protein
VPPRVATAIAALALVLTGCSGGDDGPASAGSSTPADASEHSSSAGTPTSPGSPETSIAGLPGDDALLPPDPDPGADDHLDALADVAQGPLTGHIDLQLSGLAAFSEQVTGQCERDGADPVFQLGLADGSLVRIVFDEEGATSSVSAPGVQVDQVLREVELSVTGDVHLGALLLTAGSTEPSGSLDLVARCG